MRVVVVGNGIAGINAARNMARSDAGAPIEIHMFTDEPYLYYPRPQLPFYLAGEMSLEDLIQYSDDWYEKRGIRMHLRNAVTSLQPADKSVTLADGSTAAYDRLLLANGSSAKIPPFKGADKEGVFTLRSIADAQRIQEYSRNVDTAIVIGGGLLGLETARALTVLGVKVQIVELFPRLLPIQLDEAGAAVLQRKLEQRGMIVYTKAATDAILGTDRPVGARLADGREIAGQMVVVSAGIRPNIDLAKEAGLQVNRGVLVDNTMRTSAEGIYAAGDVAEFNGRVWGIVPAAIEQSRVAAANLVADSQPPLTYVDIVPSNTLKVVGVDLTAVGVVNPEGEDFLELRRLDAEAGIYEKLVLREDKIVGAILLGDRAKVTPVTALITRGIDVGGHVNDLLRPGFDLKTLVTG